MNVFPALVSYMRLWVMNELCNFHLWYQNEKQWKTVKCDVWFMGYIMSVSGLPAEKGEQAMSDHSGGKKSPGVTAAQPGAIFLTVPNFSTLSLCIPLSLNALYRTSPLLSPLSFYPFCLPLSVFPAPLARSLQYFTELCVNVTQCGYSGGFCQRRHCHFSAFSFVRWRFNPFLTLRFHMQRQHSSLLVRSFKWSFLSQGSETGFFFQWGPLGNRSNDSAGFMWKRFHGFIVDLSTL